MISAALVIILVGLSIETIGYDLRPDDADFLQRELDNFAHRLEDTALEVKEKLHKVYEERKERSRRRKRQAEVIDLSNLNLKHGFVPQTDVGNRESVEITGFQYMPSRSVRQTLAFWEYFEYKREDFLVTYINEQGLVHVFAFDIDQDPFQGDFLESVASVSVPADHVGIFGLPQRKQPVDRFEIMFIAIYTTTELKLYCFQEIENSGSYSMQLNQTFSMRHVTDTDALIMDTDLYLILARSNNGTFDGWVQSSLYKWNFKRSQFELHQRLKTHAPVSVAATTMENKYYLVFAEKSNLTRVWKYDARQLQFKRHHSLVPAGCVAVEDFSLGFDNFIVLTMESRNEAVIYKWSGFRYEHFQTITVDNVQSWKAIQSPNCQDGVLLTLSYGDPYNTFVLYQYDYFEDQFEPLNHTSHFTNGTSYAFRSANHNIYAGVSGPYFTNYVKMFRIYTETETVPDPIVVEGRKLRRKHIGLGNDVHTLSGDIVDAERLLADSVRLQGNQVINGTKFFPKIIVTGTMDVDEIQVNYTVSYGQGPEGKHSLNYLAQNLTTQESAIEVIESTVNDSVSLDTYQEVFGVKTFWNASMINESLMTSDLTTDHINNVWIKELVDEVVWVNRQNQVITGSLAFKKDLTAQDVVVANDGFVNGIDLSQDAVTTDTEQNITGAKTFARGSLITGDLKIATGSLLNGIDISEDVVTLSGNHTLFAPMNFTDNAYFHGDIITSQTVDGVQVSSLPTNILTINGDQTVTGQVVFETTPHFKENIDLKGTVNGIDLSDLSAQSVRLNQNETVRETASLDVLMDNLHSTIFAEKSFSSDLSVEGNIEVSGYLDNVNLTEIITSKGSQTVFGEKTFTGGVSVNSTIEVSGTVDGIDLSEDVVTLTGDHVIRGVKSLNYGAHFEGDVETTGLVDGVDVSSLKSSVITKSGNQTIQGEVTFTEDIFFASDVDVRGLVERVNVTFLEEDAVYKDISEAQEVVGQKQFSGNVTLSSGFLSINGLLNGYNVSQDFLDKKSDQTITGNKTFKDGFSADANSTVSGLVDGVDISDFAERVVLESADAVITGLKIIKSEVSTNGSIEVDGEVNGIKFSSDLMTINRDQNVTGIKEFDAIEVETDIYAENITIINKVNGIPWNEFLDNRVTLSSNQHISGYFIFNESSHVTNDITLGGLVNGFNVSLLAENTLSKTKEQTITGEKNISGLVNITENATFLGLVDGVNITEWMDDAMRLTGNQQITEEKVFVDPLEIEGNIDVAGFVNGVNISFMAEDAIMKNSSDPQYISGEKIFENGLDLKSNMTVRNLVNGINVNDTITLTGSQEISGSYVFTEGLSANGDVTVDGLINGVNVSHIDVATLKLDSEENVNAHMTFTDEILVDQDVLVTELSDGVDVSELDAQALNLRDPFNFTGEITIDAPITFLDDVDLIGDSDDRDLSEWAATVVTTNTNQDINGTKVFSGLLKSDNPIKVTENLALDTAFGVNITDWSEDIVYRDENRTISGKKIFKDDVDVGGDIIVDGTVDGIDVSEEVVTLLGEQTITGKKKFSALVQANEDVEVSGFVNGYYLPNLVLDTFNLRAPMNVTGDKTFLQDLDILGDLYLTLFNSSVFQIPIKLSDDYNITGHLTFEGETEFTNDLIITGLASLQNLTEIARSRVTLSGSDQTIQGTWTVTGNVTCEGDIATNHLINGLNLLQMEQDWEQFLRQISSDIRRLRALSSEICDTIDELQDTYEGSFADLDYFESVQTIPEQSQSMTSFSYGGRMYLAVAVYAKDHVYLCVDSYIYKWSNSFQQFLLADSVTTNGAMKWTSFNIDSTKFLAVANAGVFPCIGDTNVHSDIFIFNHSLVFYQSVDIISLDVEAFTIGNKTYLVFAGDDAFLEIFVHNPDLNQFELLQTVVTESAVGAIEFVKIQNQRFLVVVESSSEVALVYEIEETGNFTLHQTISSKYAYDVTTCIIDGEVGVVFAGFSTVEEDPWGLTSQTDSLIYFWSEVAEDFEIAEYVIPFRRASDVAFLTVGYHSYILLVEQYTRVELFRYEGSGHFVSAFNIPIPGIKSVEAFSLDNEIYLAIAVDPLLHDKPSRIIKANLQGNVFKPVEDLCDVSVGEMVSHSEDDICFL